MAGPASERAESEQRGTPSTRLVEKGKLLVSIKRYEAALPLLEQAVQDSPLDSRARGSLVLALLGLERFEEALGTVDAGLAIAPKQEWALRLRSHVLVRLRRNKEAVDAAETALRCSPSWITHGALAWAYAADARLEEAGHQAALAIALAPSEPQTHIAAARVHLGANRWREAEASSRKALALDPTRCLAVNHLAVALIRQDRRQDALECFGAAVRNCPTCLTTRRNVEAALAGDDGALGPL